MALTTFLREWNDIPLPRRCGKSWRLAFAAVQGGHAFKGVKIGVVVEFPREAEHLAMQISDLLSVMHLNSDIHFDRALLLFRIGDDGSNSIRIMSHNYLKGERHRGLRFDAVWGT